MAAAAASGGGGGGVRAGCIFFFDGDATVAFLPLPTAALVGDGDRCGFVLAGGGPPPLPRRSDSGFFTTNMSPSRRSTRPTHPCFFNPIRIHHTAPVARRRRVLVFWLPHSSHRQLATGWLAGDWTSRSSLTFFFRGGARRGGALQKKLNRRASQGRRVPVVAINAGRSAKAGGTRPKTCATQTQWQLQQHHHRRRHARCRNDTRRWTTTWPRTWTG